jgi:hypothetical protein
VTAQPFDLDVAPVEIPLPTDREEWKAVRKGPAIGARGQTSEFRLHVASGNSSALLEGILESSFAHGTLAERQLGWIIRSSHAVGGWRRHACGPMTTDWRYPPIQRETAIRGTHMSCEEQTVISRRKWLELTTTPVIDGDTVVVEGVGTVRLEGVDTPGNG